MPTFPRTINPSQAERPTGMMARSHVTQRGSAQTRDAEAMGVGWRETWQFLRAGNADVEALTAFVRRHARKGTFLDVEHLDVPGSGRAKNGTVSENLIRDAAMDTDSDGDGVVDGFKTGFVQTGWSMSLNSGEGAQEVTADGTGSLGDRAEVLQYVLRVFPGDEITASAEAKLANSPSDIEGRVQIRFLDASGSFISNPSATGFTATSYQRHENTGTAPSGAAAARIRLHGVLTADSGSGDVRFRNARVLRASSDPATYANPHVSGGSQTGASLDTAGWPASTTNVVRAGDVLKIGGSGSTKANAESDEMHRVFEVAADADSDGSGNATIEIDPPILSGNSPADGAALRMQNVRYRAFIRNYTMPDAQPGDILASMRVDFREAV